MNITTITRTVALVPELIRDTISYMAWSRARLLDSMADSDSNVEALLHAIDDEEPVGGHDPEHDPLKPWQAARLGLEFVMLVRSHEQFEEDFHRTIEDAIECVDSPQHAVDVILAMANMLDAVVTDDDIEKFGKALMLAEARSS